ncbi:EscU/YscU/HrcU family type III secretion system export apparatus switch protein, partial [Escherichia coli]|uniref:EscU/YscU/HrcU family type III secretion system export apparatus switch protein n=1 Tax=Escherichia coli TaxID=562 RepID=UPI00215AAEA6
MAEEKTEKPTAKKRKESRREGQVPRTQELGAWAAVLLFALVLEVLVGRELTALARLMDRSLRLVADPAAPTALALMGDALL